MAVFTPIRRPALSSRGPPELPGLIAASVWMTSSIGVFATLAIVRPSAIYGLADPHDSYGPNRFRRLAARPHPRASFISSASASFAN